MALRGTLNDFGIANVFQLIGQQGKMGILTVANRDEQVKFFFDAGSLVRCEASRRQKAELIGNMLVRAEAITEAQLMDALGKQKGSGKRLGEVLVEQALINANDLALFARLQTSETVYRVFLWRAGTYEFAAQDIPPDAMHPPLRAESLLMEGFRQVDEWPAIRTKINSYATTFTVEQNLEEAVAKGAAEKPADDMDFDFGDEGGSAAKDPRLKNIEQKERLVYGLVTPGRDVQKIIDLSRLGEFDTCQALVNLLDAGFIKDRAPATPAQRKPSAEATVGGISAGRPQLRVTTSSFELAGWALAVVIAFAVILNSGLSVSASARQTAFVEMQLEDELARGEMQKIHEALAVYFAAYGVYPESLDLLVQSGLLPTKSLSFPWRQPYIYNRADHAYTLLRPFF